MFPFAVNQKDQVAQVLAQDWFYRKQKRWPLVTFCELGDFYASGQESSTKNLALVKRGKLVKEYTYLDASKFVKKIYKVFPALKAIFQKYKGKVVVAGGSLVRILFDKVELETDCDLFFYNTTKEEAEAIIVDCIELIGKSVNMQKLYIQRKLYVTTINVRDLPNDEYSGQLYQFIHRIYPTKDSIIGGFDLGPCMILYDGEQILLTPMGAYCIGKDCLIVDTSRRSTSFEHRIEKYSRFGLSVVFPGMTAKQFEKASKEPENQLFHQRCQKVEQLMERLGLRLDESGKPYDDLYESARPIISLSDTPLKIKKCSLTTSRSVYSENIPLSKLNYYTDYGEDNLYITDQREKMNTSHLITGNLEAVGKCIEIEGIVTREELEDFFFNTGIDITDDNPINSYKKRAFRYLTWRESALNKNLEFVRKTRTEIRLFAEFVPRVRKYQTKISVL